MQVFINFVEQYIENITLYLVFCIISYKFFYFSPWVICYGFGSFIFHLLMYYHYYYYYYIIVLGHVTLDHLKV